MLRNFDTELDTLGVSKIVRTASQAVQVSQHVEVVSHRSVSKGYLSKDASTWAWDDLRDYVVFEIEERFGAIGGRDFRKESGIFKGFMSRWGDQAVAIARYAFDVKNGYWAGEAITITRFCKGSDPYFAERIAENIHHAPAQGW